MIEEVQLDNRWLIHYKPDSDDPDEACFVRVEIYRWNFSAWQEEIRGQVKLGGCADWGFNQPVMMHFCGPQDCQILARAYEKALTFIGRELE